MGKILRKIIKIDEEKCDGCGICIDACHEGALAIIDGKAKIVRDDYCDGLGDCLPACPQDAIGFEVREAAPFDEEAVQVRMEEIARQKAIEEAFADACPGIMSRRLDKKQEKPTSKQNEQNEEQEAKAIDSQLSHWPIQIKLVPVNASYFENADLLIAADCAAYAYGSFHKDFMKDKITIIGCPKLDEGDYADKLAEIIGKNNIKSVTVVKMEVPCCGGLENAIKRALKNVIEDTGKMIPWQIVTMSVEGDIV